MNKELKQIDGGKVILYKKGLEVQLRKETVWLTQAQIAVLFGTKRPSVTKHISNIFKSKELYENSVIRNFIITANDSKKYKTHHFFAI